MTLKSISLPPRNGLAAEYLIVMLHGCGGDYHSLVQIGEMFNLPDCQFLFPEAPFPHYQILNGMAWYALHTDNFEGLDQSRQILHDWLLSLPEKTGIPLNKTVVLGLSQGGAMALDVALNLPVAAVCCLSGYLHFEPKKQDQIFPPLLMCHGISDSVIPLDLGKKAKKKLENVGVSIEYHEFEMDHEITFEEIAVINRFIKRILIMAKLKALNTIIKEKCDLDQ